LSRPDHDKVKIIVEEVVQRVYLFDPDDVKTGEIIEGLKAILLGTVVEALPIFGDNPPVILGHRAKKGRIPVAFMKEHLPTVEWKRYVGATFVLPDQNGEPALELKLTPTTATRKPVTK
jgi:hypothetical protein